MSGKNDSLQNWHAKMKELIMLKNLLARTGLIVNSLNKVKIGRRPGTSYEMYLAKKKEICELQEKFRLSVQTWAKILE